MNITRDWNEFWFARRPSGPLGLYRIVLGALVLLWALLLAPDLFTWFSERGVIPLAGMRAWNGPDIHYEFNVLEYVRDPRIIVAAFALLVVAALCMTVGFCTRTACIIVWVLVSSFERRDTIILNSGDIFMRVMCFYMMFAPAGASCSVDRMIRIWRGKETPGDPPTIVPWAQRLIQLQISIVYLSTFLGKAQGPRWMDGTAIYYPLHMAEMARFPVPFVGTNIFLINLFTYGTLAIELSMATLVWVPRLRGYVLSAGALLHLGIEYALNIPLFSFLMISSYINFLPNEWIARLTLWVSRRLERRAILVQYAPSGALPQLIAVLRRLDAFHLVTFAPAEHDLGAAPALLAAIDRHGAQRLGVGALSSLLWRLPAAWGLALLSCLPGVAKLGERALSRWAQSNLAETPPSSPELTVSRS